LPRVKPVDQTRFGVPGGNCYQACLASLLELGLEEIPEDLAHGDGTMARTNAWLAPRGFCMVCFSYRTTDLWHPPAGAWHVLSGPSPRGDFWHSTVGRDGQLVHDPHPSRAGLVGEEREVDLLVLIDPARLAALLRAQERPSAG
jgi:hypothetical protein